MAENHGILVGVSDYPYLDKSLNLVGPRNDVLLMYEVLQQKGIPRSNLHLLTERHPDALTPSRDNILDTLSQVLDQSENGDFVYLHFSGHGSQQPATTDKEEIDGLDEIFLPADTKNWRASLGSVENAISDDEISSWLDRFSARGVFVWLVFDSCHSGTMSRSQWQSRKVPASLLGVPQSRNGRQDNSAPVSRTQAGSASGGYVAFFAAQTNEETPEMPLPKSAASPERYGLFTYHLIQSITQHPGATYRQIAEKIIQNYSAQLWFGSRPVFTGNQLDAPVFTSKSTADAPVQWPINKHNNGYEIAAGDLLGLGQGSLFAVLPAPTATLSEALGYARSTTTEALTSQLEWIEHQTNNKHYPPLERIPDTAFARLVESRFSNSLTISAMEHGAGSETFNKVVSKLKGVGIAPVQLIWRDDSQQSDVKLLPQGDSIVLLTDGEPLPCTHPDNREAPQTPSSATSKPEVSLPETALPEATLPKECEERAYHTISIADVETGTEALTTSLRTIAKAKGLLKLGTVIGGDALDVTLNVKRKQGGKIDRYDGSDVPTLYTGDKLTLTIANFVEQPIDITVLFVGSDFGVSVAFPRKNQFNRFMEEEEKVIPLGTVNAKTTGHERIIVIATHASRSATASNFAFLAQQGLKARNNPDPISALISEAGFGNSVQPRGDMPVSTSVREQADIKTISWITAKQ